jgi:hypothetical protein
MANECTHTHATPAFAALARAPRAVATAAAATAVYRPRVAKTWACASWFRPAPTARRTLVFAAAVRVCARVGAVGAVREGGAVGRSAMAKYGSRTEQHRKTREGKMYESDRDGLTRKDGARSEQQYK